jgi:ATPase subunit of ABC transporter with duplicated ATPase domains
MVVRPAEFVAVAGDAGAGKSTLLLCASGFLHTDLGSVRWGPAAADGAQRAYLPCAAGIAAANPAALLCVDDVEDVEALRDAVAPALARGAAVLAAVRDAAGAAAAGARVSILREGRLVPLLPPPEPARAMTRVAERERGGVDPFAWRA